MDGSTSACFSKRPLETQGFSQTGWNRFVELVVVCVSMWNGTNIIKYILCTLWCGTNMVWYKYTWMVQIKPGTNGEKDLPNLSKLIIVAFKCSEKSVPGREDMPTFQSILGMTRDDFDISFQTFANLVKLKKKTLQLFYPSVSSLYWLIHKT